MERVMVFVDGENLCFRGQEFLRASGIELIEGKFFMKDVFLWMEFPPEYRREKGILGDIPSLSFNGHHIVRTTYYTSVYGDDDKIKLARTRIWEMGLQPCVFKKTRRESKAKGVDVALTKDMLVHSFGGNYDTAVLVAGDGDYVPLVEEVKRQGRRVVLHFLADGLSEDLKLACDGFRDISRSFVSYWSDWRHPVSEHATLHQLKSAK